MTVAELIAELQKMPQDLPAAVHDGIQCPPGIGKVKEVKVILALLEAKIPIHHERCVLITT